MSVLPDGWCPGLAEDERLARLLLDQRHPELCYHLVDDVEVRASLARIHAGNVLQERIDKREWLLGDELERVHVVVGFLSEVTGLALAALEAS